MARNRNAKGRITIPTPEEIAQRRAAAQDRRLAREDEQRRAERRPDGFGVNEAALGMAVNADVEVKRDQRGKATSVWRSNPFKLLCDSGSISQDEANAAFDLLAIYAASKGLDGGPERHAVVVDGGNPDAWGAEDRKQYHIRLWGLVVDALTAKSAKLAKAFAFALVEEDRPVAWRGIVERELGEARRDSQTVRVNVMCEELLSEIPTARKALKDWLEQRRAA